MSKTWFKKRKCSQKEAVPVNDADNNSAKPQRKYFDRDAVIIPVHTNNDNTHNSLSQQEIQPPKRQGTIPNTSMSARRYGISLFSVADCLAMCINRPATISPSTPTKKMDIETNIEVNTLTSWNESEVTTNDGLHYNSDTDEEYPMTPPAREDTLTECKNREGNLTNYSHVTSQSKCGNSEVLGAVNTICSYNIEVKEEPVDIDVEDCKPSMLKSNFATQAYYGDSENDFIFPEFIFCDSKSPYFFSNAKPFDYGAVSDGISLPSQSMSKLPNVTRYSTVKSQLQHVKSKPSNSNIAREQFSIDTSFAKYLHLNINYEKEDIKYSLRHLNAKYSVHNNLKQISSGNSNPLRTDCQVPAVLHPSQSSATTSGIDFVKAIRDARSVFSKRDKKKPEDENVEFPVKNSKDTD